MKRCPVCRTDKPSTAFYSDRTKVSGLAAVCRDCIQAKAAAKKAKRVLEEEDLPEPPRVPHCPICVTEYRKHETVPGLYFCANAFCREFDMAKHVRVYVNGARAA